MLMRRLAAVTVLLAAAAVAAPAAGGAPLPIPPVHTTAPDRLTVTVSETGEAADAERYRLECHPTGGDHPNAPAACAQLDENTEWGKDTFAATPRSQMCTQVHGGPATARIEGTWQGRAVDSEFSRANGCEVQRWERFGEVLTTASR